VKCRHCNAALKLPLIDLGCLPLSNAYLEEQRLKVPEEKYPLRVLVCEKCWLAQTEDFAAPQTLFNADYAYFSGCSTTWLAHCERYVENVTARFGLDKNSHVIEVAANDGSLLNFFKVKGISCLGIEPTDSAAAAARAKGIDILKDFFCARLASELTACGKQANLVIANNVLAHVPNINDFVAGFAILLKPRGIATFEFPHLLRLVTGGQFDTIYHEHFSYLSFTSAQIIFERSGFSIFDVEELTTHGGSLRVYAQRAVSGEEQVTERVSALLAAEADAGITSRGFYAGLQTRAEQIKDGFLFFLREARKAGKSVAAYGAAAKGNTLLNYAGVRSELIMFAADLNPAKQGKYMPGSHIPIRKEDDLKASKPDYVVVLPWNLKDEIIRQLSYIREWGGKFVTAVPNLEIL
jgi:SAM-dependent methyltransferase